MKSKNIPVAAAMLFSSVLLSGCIVSVGAAEEGSDVSKVFGGIEVRQGTQQGDISSVNGGVKLASNSSAGNISVVNGSVNLADNTRVKSVTTVNGGIEAGRKFTADGEVTTVNGKIRVQSQSLIGGDVVTVNGLIELTDTEVKGSVSTVNGDIRLQGKTRVKGDIVFKENRKKSALSFSDKKPELYIAADAVVEGQIILEQPVTLKLENPAMKVKVTERY